MRVRCFEVVNRRRLLRSTAGLTATALSAAAGFVWPLRPAAGIEPLSRTGSKFKFSLAAYSYRQLLKSGELTLSDFVDDCARFGLDGTELTSYYFPDPVTDAYLRKLKRHCFRQGLDVSGTAVRNDFGYSTGLERDAEIRWVKRWIEYAAKLGAPVVRIFAGHAQGSPTPRTLHRNVVDGIADCCQYAGEHGVHLALENHGGPTSTVDGLLAIVRDVDNPWFGVNLDTGNFHSAEVYRDLRKAAPYALNVQVKVSVSNAEGQKAAADFPRLANLLREANYRGYVVLEFEEAGDPRSECERHLDALRTAFGA